MPAAPASWITGRLDLADGVCVRRRGFAHALDGTTGHELIQVAGGHAS
jgi:hypothetical protein